MSTRKKRSRLLGGLTAVLGFACALVLGALFYGSMVYQHAGEQPAEGARLTQTPAPLGTADAAAQFPGAALALSGGTLIHEAAEDVRVGGQTCRVLTRTYQLEDGTLARAVSAAPAAYLEWLAQEGFMPQLITGFIVAGMDAVCEARGEETALAARNGDFVYLILATAQEQAMYALGAGALLETPEE